MFGGGVWVILFECFWYTCRWKKCMKKCVSVFKMLKSLLEMPFIDLLTCLPRTYTNSLTCWLVGHLLSLDSILFMAGVWELRSSWQVCGNWEGHTARKRSGLLFGWCLAEKMFITCYEVYSTNKEQEFIAIFEYFSLDKFYTLRVCLDRTYFAETKN